MSAPTKNTATTRAASLAARAQEITFKEVKAPASTENFETAFKESSGIKTGTANRFTINVLPSYVPILLFIMYHVQQNISFLEPKNHAKVSSMTFIAYCLTIVYGHLLLTDMHVNPDKTDHALEIENDTQYRDFADFLLSLPVPEFLVPVLKYFTTTTSARRRNVWFAYSPAGFNHYMHFGRYFPINIFTALHDYAATTYSRTHPNTVRFEFNDLDIFKITNFDAANSSKTYKLREFFASYFTVENAPRYLGNKVNQALESVFNPVLLRAQQQRQTFTEIALPLPTFKNANYNPYLAMFSLNPRSAAELRTVLATFKAVLNGSVPCKTTLAGIFSDYAGTSIMTHGYSAFALPTWNAHTGTIATSDTRCRPLSDEDYATAITFKRDLAGIPAASRHLVTEPKLNTLVTITPPPPATPAPTITVRPANDRYLVNDDATGPSNADDTRNMTSHTFTPVPYSTERDFLPIVKILNPTQEDTVSAWLTTLCGMIIECDELTGSITPHPHPDSRVEEENAQFAMSAISFRHAFPATGFKTTTPWFSFRVLPDRPQYTSPAAVSLFRSQNEVFIPTLTNNRVHLGYDRINYGLSRLYGIAVPQLVQTFLGFRINNRATVAHTNTIHEPSSSPYETALVWSPYTYVPAGYDPTWDHTNQDNARLDLFFITNLRTIFGTDVTLMELNHPLFAMPIA